MKFGHFDDVKKEYVISNPRTPYPWINYLGTGVLLISQHSREAILLHKTQD